MRVLLLLLASCTTDYAWDDVPTAIVTAHSEYPEHTTGWSEQVTKDMDSWNTVMVNVGCTAPFVMGANGNPVTLVRYSNWPANSNIRGVTTSDGIKVRVPFFIINHRLLDHPAILLHEFGHAIGLGHSDSIHGASIMTPEPTSDVITELDVKAAACLLGCGSCDEDL